MENFAKKLALEHNVKGKASKKFYPMKDLKKDMEVIAKAYDVLQESIALDVPIPPSGEWILDNYYILEEQVECIRKELKLKEYVKLPAVNHKARMQELCTEFVKFTDGNITKENIEKMMQTYEEKRKISMQEIWLLPVFLKISLIQYIRMVAERIISSQYQKFKVASLMERVIKNKSYNEQVFSKYKGINLNGEISSYVEYMVYLLKREGKSTRRYLNFLTEEMKKAGTTLDDVIKMEHFDMVYRRISVGNSITSIKNILRYNWSAIFEQINGIEEILREDIWYAKSDFDTKTMYRNEIQKIGKRAQIAENYIASVLIKLAKEEKKHIGEYLIGEKKFKLYEALGIQYHKEKSMNQKLALYIFAIYFPTVALSLFLMKYAFWILLIPLSEVFVLLVNRIVAKIRKPQMLPKLEEVPEDVATFVIVPTLLNSAEKTIQAIQNLEIFYLANKIPNLYFALLGDASEEKTEAMPFDDAIQECGVQAVKELNEKYGEERFFFLYRRRVWNASQGKWLGYERKRGMITEFVDFLMNGNAGTFGVNTINEIPKIKYCITLDSDTILPMDSAKKLIGAMEHPMNQPEIKEKIVTRGYALLQPKVGISMKSATASGFSKVFAGDGGIDCYSTAESNVYQDLFGEAIFTGKGIFNVTVFHQLLKEEIPENTVLSHDLLEGSYLRTGLASDICVIDGFPARVNSYFLRFHRWTRGDWQIAKWILKGPLNALSRYKIWDNLRRSLVDIFLLLLIFNRQYALSLLIVFFPFFVDVVSKLWTHKIGVRFKNYLPIVSGLEGSFLRSFFSLMILPYKAYLMLKAICVTIYRVCISKKHLLEWVTAADSERILGHQLKKYIMGMFFSILAGVALIALAFLRKDTNLAIAIFLGVLWGLAPFISYFISCEKTCKNLNVSKQNEEKLSEIAKRTWNYFATYMNEQNNFLPPDNYQENRKKEVTSTTSSTNIGLGLLTILSAYDLKYISLEECLQRLKSSIDSIHKLEKWYGHLYNWYDIQTLEPLQPRFVSTVDSGNYVGYLFVVREFLQEHKEIAYAEIVNQMIWNTDFSKLYDYDKHLFSVGFDVRNDKLVDSYYDLLASESRLASFIAIAKKDVPYKHWFSLSRALTSIDRYKGLVSWSGTMFEYFMPYIVMKSYDYTLLDESYDFCIYSQKKYAKQLNIPWGISESAFNLQDLHSNYQYKAFGIPWLGLKRGLKDEVVVAPYSSFLAIDFQPNEVIKNANVLEQLGAYDKFGFYDAIDYTPNRVDKKGYSVVKTYMAHHQALVFISINNFLNHRIMQKRFSANPEIQAAELLLQERVPTDVIMTKKKKEKVKALKYKNYEEHIENTTTEMSGNSNIQSNHKYTLVLNDFGEGYAKFDGLQLTKYNSRNRVGNCVYIKNLENGNVITNTPYPIYHPEDEYEVKFSPSKSCFYRKAKEMEVTTQIGISPEDNVEVRELTLKNTTNQSLNLDVISYVEPVIADKNNDIVHPAYHNLFFRANQYEDAIILEKKSHKGSIYYMNFFVADNCHFEFELDKMKIIGRLRDITCPNMIEQDVAFSNESMVSTSTIISFKNNLKLEASESKKIRYYYAVSSSYEEMIELYKKYHNEEYTSRIFEMAYSKSVVENRFLGYKGKDIALYNQLFSILFNNQTRNKYLEKINSNILKQNDLWRFGISGDLPIILLKISRVNDIYVVKDAMLAIEYFYKKSLYTDLVIINEEENKYEQYVQDKLYETISNKGLNYLIHKNGGIHIIKKTDITSEEEKLLLSCSDLILTASDGFLKEQICSIKDSGDVP